MVTKKEWLAMSQEKAKQKYIKVMVTDNSGLLLSEIILPIGRHHKSPGETESDAAQVIENLITERYETKDIVFHVDSLYPDD